MQQEPAIWGKAKSDQRNALSFLRAFLVNFGSDAASSGQGSSALRMVPISVRRRRRESGAILLAVLFMMAVMILVALVVVPSFVLQARRDRELEMIHRGTEYARAVKKYYKKFGQYPANLEQL
ncbi:MAG TPA: hypothetical protein VF783_15650, partial [Terriglobales bacterium]